MSKYNICIYCKKSKPNKYFDTEHVLHQSMGKFRNNLTLNCVYKKCNSTFGESIDLIFGRDSVEALLRYYHGIKDFFKINDLRQKNLNITYDGNEPWKGIRLTVEVDEYGLVLNILPQAGIYFKKVGRQYFNLYELRQINYPIDNLCDKNRQIKLIYFNDNDLNDLLFELKKLNIPFKKEGYLPSIDVSSEDIKTSIISYTNVNAIKRVLCKIAFNYVAYNIGSEKVLSSDFDAIRTYIINGKEPNYCYFLGTHPDLNLLPNNVSNDIYHIIRLDWTNDFNPFVDIQLFNVTHYHIFLTKKYNGFISRDYVIGHCYQLNNHRVFKIYKSRIILP